jgi:mannose-6-phosphate isomerase-like protein (cupin superfamily)
MHDISDPFPTLVTGFGYAPLAPALWLPDEVTGLKYRDLSLDQASEGALVGRHLRTGGFAIRTDRLIDPDAAFLFLFVQAGRIMMTEEGKDPVLLEPLSSATRYGGGKPVIFDFSHDAEIIEMKAAPSGSGLFGRGDGNWIVNTDMEQAYLQGDGPRAYFRYRDLGVAKATSRRIHIHVVRSTRAIEGGTGWHSHTMSQLFYVLRGWADLAVERRPWVKMSSGDSMCLSKGMRHNVVAFSEDYLVLEMCIPADYDTIAG